MKAVLCTPYSLPTAHFFPPSSLLDPSRRMFPTTSTPRSTPGLDRSRADSEKRVWRRGPRKVPRCEDRDLRPGSSALATRETATPRVRCLRRSSCSADQKAILASARRHVQRRISVNTSVSKTIMARSRRHALGRPPGRCLPGLGRRRICRPALRCRPSRYRA